MTTNTTLTFASDAENQAKVELLNDPAKPGWEEFLARTRQRVDNEEERDRDDDRLFGTRIREAVRVLKRR